MAAVPMYLPPSAVTEPLPAGTAQDPFDSDYDPDSEPDDLQDEQAAAAGEQLADHDEAIAATTIDAKLFSPCTANHPTPSGNPRHIFSPSTRGRRLQFADPGLRVGVLLPPLPSSCSTCSDGSGPPTACLSGFVLAGAHVHLDDVPVPRQVPSVVQHNEREGYDGRRADKGRRPGEKGPEVAGRDAAGSAAVEDGTTGLSTAAVSRRQHVADSMRHASLEGLRAFVLAGDGDGLSGCGFHDF